MTFVGESKLIAMRLGRGFGIRYRVRGLPKDRSFRVTGRITYPRAIRDASGWEHTSRHAPTNELEQHLLYEFVYDWEMVAGAWRFQILVDNQPACSYTFQVK